MGAGMFGKCNDFTFDNRESKCNRLRTQAIKIGWASCVKAPRGQTRRLNGVDRVILKECPKGEAPSGCSLINVIDFLAKNLVTRSGDYAIV